MIVVYQRRKYPFCTILNKPLELRVKHSLTKWEWLKLRTIGQMRMPKAKVLGSPMIDVYLVMDSNKLFFSYRQGFEGELTILTKNVGSG